MQSSRRKTGDSGEHFAADFLKKKGYNIIQRNYRCKEGEIDIIAEQDDCLVFVEVRTKKGANFGTPEESITSAKKERLVSLADVYIQSCDVSPASWRIDVIAIELGAKGKINRLNHIENAID